MAGTPIIANKVGGITDILIPDKNGLFFEPSKEESLLLCIERIIGDDWEHFSRQARDSFLSTFVASEHNLNIQIDLLDSLLNSKLT